MLTNFATNKLNKSKSNIDFESVARQREQHIQDIRNNIQNGDVEILGTALILMGCKAIATAAVIVKENDTVNEFKWCFYVDLERGMPVLSKNVFVVSISEVMYQKLNLKLNDYLQANPFDKKLLEKCQKEITRLNNLGEFGRQQERIREAAISFRNGYNTFCKYHDQIIE